MVSRMMYACANGSTTHRLVKLNTGTPTFQRAPGEEVERDDRHGDDDHRPGGEVLGERDDDPLGDGDAQSELEA